MDINKKDINKKTGKFNLNDGGFTLVELVISLVISLLVVAAASFILLTQSGVIRLNRSVSTEQQRLNTAFNAVRYSLRMAGFDYAQSYFIQTGSVPPVQIVQASYPANPYEVLVSYDVTVNPSTPCMITAVANGNSASSEFNLGQYCNIDNFYQGQVLNVTGITSVGNNPLPPPPVILCVTNVEPNANQPYGRIQLHPGSNSCPGSNPNNIPPKSIYGGQIAGVSPVNQVLFYWGNTKYNFNAPLDVPGNLYECLVNPVAYEPPAAASYTAPVCAANTTIILSDYINNFTVTASAQTNTNFNPAQPYLYYLSITGESSAALSDSPAYSIDSPYNKNANGVNAIGNAGQNIGNNVLKTLNTNVFLRNVYYGY